MSKEFEAYHGIALCRIIHCNKVKSIIIYPSKSNSSYILNDDIGIYVKYSTKRMSPWNFTFKREHQDEIFEMKQVLREVFLILVCRDDGIACLRFDELKQILDEVHEDVEWVSVRRRPREKYRVSGHDGKLKFKIADSHFPIRIFDKTQLEPHFGK